MINFLMEVFVNVFVDVIGGFIISDLLMLISIPYDYIIVPIVLWFKFRNLDLKDEFEYYSYWYNKSLDNYEWFKERTSLMMHYSLATLLSYIDQKFYGKKLSKISKQLLKEQEI